MTRRRENSCLYRDLNSSSSVIQPVASHYTDYAFLAPLQQVLNLKKSCKIFNILLLQSYSVAYIKLSLIEFAQDEAKWLASDEIWIP
jgi:hypothetical protein